MAWLILLLAPEFTNVAAQEGLEGPPAGRAVFVDIKGTGDLTVVLNRRDWMVRSGKPARYRQGRGLPTVPDLVLFADFDNDGDQDCFTAWHTEPTNPKWVDHGQKNTIFLNEGGKWRAVENPFPRTSVHAACALDYDRDGILDLYVGSGYVIYGNLLSHPDRLYRGLGGGKFEDVTESVGLLTVPEVGRSDSSKPTYGVTHGDFDGDGWQDLWVCTYGRQWNFLWRNVDGKSFKNVAPGSGFEGDSDRSGAYPKWLKERWKKRFGSERPDEPPFRSNGNTFDCAIADFDNDGDMDCILAEITHEWAGSSSDVTSLLINLGDGKFKRVPDAFRRTRTTKGPWNQGDIHCGWLDYDNDGLLDAVIASSDYPDRQELKIYRQRPDHTFDDVRFVNWEGAGQISFGDYDKDGDLDILVGRSVNRLPREKRIELGRSVGLFRNDVGHKNRWLQVVCRGSGGKGGSNRDGIGARITVTQVDGTKQTREIRGGLGHAGHNGPYVAHFGLGKDEKPVCVTVRWPNASRTLMFLKTVASNQRLVLEEQPRPK